MEQVQTTQPAPLEQPLPSVNVQAAPVQGGDAAPSDLTTNGSDAPFSLWDTVFLSIFTKHAPKREWTPLYANTFFSEGWFEPHIAPPETTGGSVRQGWAGLNDVFFNRMADFIYNNYHGNDNRPNEQVGTLDLETPISRRAMIGVIIPYVDSLYGNGQSSVTSFADTILESRFILTETKDLTITANFNVRVPTGSSVTGNHRTDLLPYIGWYKDLGYNGWSFRGLAGITDPLSGSDASRVVSFYQTVGIGQTLTKHDVPWFGDFTYYLIMNTVESQNTNTFLSFTPGFRTHLGRNWFLLAGLEVPVTDNAGYSTRLNMQLVKGF